MKQLTIFVDMDGTIERLLDAWVARLNKSYNLNVKCEDITAWDMSIAFPVLTKNELYGPLQDDSIWTEVEPMEGAAEVLKKWVDAGHQVYIVTATPYQSLRSKMDNLLFRYFSFLSWKNVIITENKHLLRGDVMIDDGVHNLIGGEYKKVLFDAPYNRDIDDGEYGIIRAHNWDEVEKIIDNLETR